MSKNVVSNIIWTVVTSSSYVVSKTYICKRMINSGYKQVILLSGVILVYFRSLSIRHIIKKYSGSCLLFIYDRI